MAINNARDVYTRRNEGVSIWAVRSPTSPPARRAPRGRCSSRRTAKCIAIRPSSRFRRSWGTCNAGGRPPVRIRAAARRQLPDPGPPRVRMVRPRPDPRGRPGAGEHRARPARARPSCGWRWPASWRGMGGTPTSSPSCATPGSSATCCWSSSENGDFAVTMARQFFFDAWHHLLLQGCSDRRDAADGRDRRQVGQGGRLPPGAQPRLDHPPGRRDRGEPSPGAASRRHALALHRRDVRGGQRRRGAGAIRRRGAAGQPARAPGSSW